MWKKQVRLLARDKRDLEVGLEGEGKGKGGRGADVAEKVEEGVTRRSSVCPNLSSEGK